MVTTMKVMMIGWCWRSARGLQEQMWLKCCVGDDESVAPWVVAS